MPSWTWEPTGGSWLGPSEFCHGIMWRGGKNSCCCPLRTPGLVLWLPLLPVALSVVLPPWLLVPLPRWCDFVIS